MKHYFRLFPYLLLAVTAVLVLVYSFQTRLVDLDRHNAASQNLLQLKQLDTQLNEEMLKAVSLQLSNYDRIVATVSRMKAVSTLLHNPETGLYGLIGPKIDRQLDSLSTLMEQKLDLVETVKSRTAIVRNTLNYLPGEITRLTENRSGPVQERLHALINAVLSYNLIPSPRTRLKLTQAIEVLQNDQLNSQDQRDIGQMMRQVQTNLAALDEINTSMTWFFNLPTAMTLDRIFQDHTEFSTEQFRQSHHFRITMLVVALSLFLTLGYALVHLHRAQEQAEQTSRQFRDAAESIGEGFAFFDAQAHLSFWNSTFERLHEGMGKALRKGISFDDFQAQCFARKIYQRVPDGKTLPTERGIVENFDHPYTIKTSNQNWVLARDNRMSDGGIACTRVDITESKRVEEELHKLSRAVEQSPASVMITNTDGIITYVNPKFEQSTGYSAAEAVGQTPKLITSGDKTAEDYADMWRILTAGGEWRGEFHNKRKDGTLFWEFASISPIKNDQGETVSYLAVKEDITDRKKVIAELIKAKEQAELSSQAKTEFLANMSHELRTPLNAIIGFSEMIKTQVFGPVGHENYVEYSTNILLSGEHLLRVINDILDISRIETGTMSIREQDINVIDIAHACLDVVRAQTDFAKLSLKGSFGKDVPQFYGDEERIKQIILRLLSNAVKFTPQGGHIDLRVRLDDAGALEISVKDTGCGIPEEQLEAILEPFGQVSNVYTRSHEGSGMGLFLVNSFVKLHGGRLEIKSDGATGTTVIVHMPVERNRPTVRA